MRCVGWRGAQSVRVGGLMATAGPSGGAEMTKVDIARRIHERAEISEPEAEELLEWILDLLKFTLRTGEDITIVGFGRFRVRTKNARTGRNLRTGEEITIPRRRVVTFHASPLFKDNVAGTEENTTEQ
jgi:nucleoid DNA-binding protein